VIESTERPRDLTRPSHHWNVLRVSKRVTECGKLAVVFGFSLVVGLSVSARVATALSMPHSPGLEPTHATIAAKTNAWHRRLRMPAGTRTVTPRDVVLWRGGFETRNFSQWTGGGNCQVQATRVPGSCYSANWGGDGDIELVKKPVWSGRYAAKHVVYPGNPSSDGIERADLALSSGRANGEVNGTLAGTTYWYHLSMLFPGPAQNWWPTFCNFNTVMDFHPGDDGTGPNQIVPIELGINNCTGGPPFIYSERAWGCCGDFAYRNVSGRLRYGRWYSFIWRITWSTTSGGVALWVDGRRKWSYSRVPTMDAGDHPYWKEALYRRAFSSINTVIQDGACRGTSFKAVARC
jgi:hypothetical protein